MFKSLQNDWEKNSDSDLHKRLFGKTKKKNILEDKFITSVHSEEFEKNDGFLLVSNKPQQDYEMKTLEHLKQVFQMPSDKNIQNFSKVNEDFDDDRSFKNRKRLKKRKQKKNKKIKKNDTFSNELTITKVDSDVDSKSKKKQEVKEAEKSVNDCNKLINCLSEKLVSDENKSNSKNFRQMSNNELKGDNPDKTFDLKIDENINKKKGKVNKRNKYKHLTNKKEETLMDKNEEKPSFSQTKMTMNRIHDNEMSNSKIKKTSMKQWKQQKKASRNTSSDLEVGSNKDNITGRKGGIYNVDILRKIFNSKGKSFNNYKFITGKQKIDEQSYSSNENEKQKNDVLFNSHQKMIYESNNDDAINRKISVNTINRKISVKNKSDTSLHERMLNHLTSSKFRYLNEMLYTRTGSQAYTMFLEDPQLFQIYHQGYQNQASKWPENPVIKIIEFIKQRPSSLVIADFGCGDAKITQSVPNTVYSFDLVALNEHVIACDMANVPLQNKSVDIAVFCISLMGINFIDYLMEANRVLKIGGILKIAEIKSRIEDLENFTKNCYRLGFKIINKDLSNKIFLILDFKKSLSVNRKIQLNNFILHPCMYKKR